MTVIFNENCGSIMSVIVNIQEISLIHVLLEGEITLDKIERLRNLQPKGS